MTTLDKRRARRTKLWFLAIGTAVLFYFCYQIASPYLRAIIGAAILAIIFHPLYLKLRSATNGKESLAAALTLVILLVTLVVPSLLMIKLLQNEAGAAFHDFRSQASPQTGWPEQITSLLQQAAQWAGIHLGIDPDRLRSEAFARLNQFSNFIARSLGSILGSVTSGIVSFVITLFTLFFLLRSGSRWVRRGVRLLPLDASEVDLLLNRISGSIQGNVLGVLAVGGIQGVLAGLGFSIFGVPSPVLWALVTAACSVIPLGGAALVWVPASLYLLLNGAYLKGILMAAWGAGIVSLSDNIVRPWVVSEKANMPPLLIFFALLGGVQVFGFWGVFLGPVVVSLARTFFAMLIEEWQGPHERPVAPSAEEVPTASAKLGN